MVEANSVIPLYKQIVRALSDSIANGTYRPGDKLPTEAELIEQFGVSRITVRSAIKEMEDAGLVEKARGKGTFVSSDTQMYAADDRESFTHSCQLAGKQASTRVLAMGWDFPSLRDAKFLGVDDIQKVLRSRRLRLVDDKPTMLETNSYSAVLSFLEHESLEDSLMAVLDRHTEFFNITPHVLPFVAGLTVSMEEQAAADKNFDTSSINAMKVGLMGPLSGIGDSFYWGTFRVVAAGIGIGIASTGNPLGPIVYALIYSVINFATRIVAAHLGYDLGTKFLQQSEENNLMSRMTHAAGVLGMTVIGAMIAAQVSLSTALTFDVGGSEIVLQDLFDSIFPGLLPLLATFACVALYKKGVKTIWIILGIFAICIIGTGLGVFAAA